MRRSKLEMHIAILKVLAQNGPLKLTHIMYKANVNCSVLKKYLKFLIKQAVIEKRNIGDKRVVFAITQKGISVLKHFRAIRTLLPIERRFSKELAVPY
jgi:predicted transcriptional regulator